MEGIRKICTECFECKGNVRESGICCDKEDVGHDKVIDFVKRAGNGGNDGGFQVSREGDNWANLKGPHTNSGGVCNSRLARSYGFAIERASSLALKPEFVKRADISINKNQAGFSLV